MRVPSLLILEPPYANARRLHDLPPELGAIALLDAVPSRPSTNEVRSQMELAPWCPLCIIAAEDSGMRTTRRLPRTCLVFGGGEEEQVGEAILRAVSARPRPTPSDLVEWITRRTRVPTVGRLLSELFTRPALRFSPYKTSAKGIYICSSSTPPGGGVHGMCGVHAAHQALVEIFGKEYKK